MSVEMEKSTMVRVTAALLVKDGKLLIAKRNPTLKLGNQWELPGGKVEHGETPEACLRREMKEEFDIEVSVGECLGSFIHHYPFGSIELMGYRACHLSGALRPVDHSEIRWVTADQLNGFGFTPADRPIVRRIETGEILIQNPSCPPGKGAAAAHGSEGDEVHTQTVRANGIDMVWDAFGDPAGTLPRPFPEQS